MGSMMSATMYTLFIARYRYDAMDYYTHGDQYLGDGSMNFWKIANSIRFPACAWYAEDTTNNAAGSIMMQVIGNEEMNMVAKETSTAMTTTTTTMRTWSSALMLSSASERWTIPPNT